MAAAWPALADVKAYLRLGSDTADDTVISEQLAAAIAWVTARVDPHYVPGTSVFIPPFSDALFTVTVMEAGRLYRRRDSVDGTIGWGDMGLVRVGPKDPDIETLIAAYLAIVV
jgi:hypothetical protein